MSWYLDVGCLLETSKSCTCILETKQNYNMSIFELSKRAINAPATCSPEPSLHLILGCKNRLLKEDIPAFASPQKIRIHDPSLGGGNSNMFMFTLFLQRWSIFDEHIFQMGWNHQVDQFFTGFGVFIMWNLRIPTPPVAGLNQKVYGRSPLLSLSNRQSYNRLFLEENRGIPHDFTTKSWNPCYVFQFQVCLYFTPILGGEWSNFSLDGEFSCQL